MQDDKKSREEQRKEERQREEKQKEELLAGAFDDCMEEQLSFIPTEREIARMHRFSDEFTEKMEEMCRTQGRPQKKEITKKEFVYSFNRIAACILMVLVVGGVFAGGFFLMQKGVGRMGGAESAQDTAQSDEETVKNPGAEKGQGAELAEEETAEEKPAEENPEEGVKPEDGYEPEELVLSQDQDVLSATEEVRTLVSSPVLARNASFVKVTVGNLGQNAVSYEPYLTLQVQVDGLWYDVPKKEDTPDTQGAEATVLDPGMARDEMLSLEDYRLDYEAEEYRALVYIDGVPFASQFRFETIEEGLEEAFEEE